MIYNDNIEIAILIETFSPFFDNSKTYPFN